VLTNQFNWERHQIVSVPFAGYLRNRFQDERFFVYRHRKHGRFVVSYWLNKDRGTFLELLSRPTLASFQRSDVADIEWWYHKKGPTGKEIRTQILAAERDRLRKLDDQDAEFQDWSRSVSRRAGVHNEDVPLIGQPLMVG